MRKQSCKARQPKLDGRRSEPARAAAELSPASLALASDDAVWQTSGDEIGYVADVELHQSQPSVYSLSEDRELFEDFLVEAKDHLDQIERMSLLLEQDAANLDAIHDLFRNFHSLKGLAGFLGLPTVRDVAHQVESILDLARNGQYNIKSREVDLFLEAADFLRQCAREVEEQLLTGVPAIFPDPHSLLQRVQELLSPSALRIHRYGAPKEDPMDLIPTSAGRQGVESGFSGGAVKVGTAKLDLLIAMVGEMLIAQSLVQHDPVLAQQRDASLNQNLAQLARITDRLRKTAIALRLVPVDQLFQRMTRLVRDLSRKSGKRAEVVLSGETTELDRHIVEQLADPVLHMVRNAVDHGLELPETRVRAGKPAIGRISLRAAHEAGSVVIEIADDGAGLNQEKILQKARDLGLIAPAATPAPAEIFELIFHPGFTTADKLTDISGRGVGMDVVKKQLAKLRGHIEIQSKPGQGTTFRLKLPLSLASVNGLVVRVAKEPFILPLYSVRDLIRPAAQTVEMVENRAETVLVNGELLPLVRLSHHFRLPSAIRHPSEGVAVVLEEDQRRYALLVDDVLGQQEVVIKGLGPAFAGAEGIAGGAILGDGRVGLMLDLEGIFHSLENGRFQAERLAS